MILTVILAAFGVVAMPGPTNALVAVRAARPDLKGALLGVPVALGAYSVATSLYLAAGVLIGDLGKPLAMAMKLIVVAYLAYLAFRLWTNGGASAAAASPSIGLRLILVTTLLNPKALLLAYIIRQGADWRHHLTEAAAGVVLAGVAGLAIWFSLGRAGGAALGAGAGRYISRVAAVIVVMAIGLLLWKIKG